MTPATTTPLAMRGECELAQRIGFCREHHLEVLARVLMEKVMPRNPDGFTFDPIMLSVPVFPEFVYITSLLGCGARFANSPQREEVFAWLGQHAKHLTRSGFYVGGWLNRSERVYELDLSCAVLGLDEAVALARANHQVAIFYPFDHLTIPVNGCDSTGCLTGVGNEKLWDSGRDA